MEKNSIFNYSLSDLEIFLVENNYKKYIGNQIYDWIYKKMVTSFDEMTNININTRNFLKEKLYIPQLEELVVEESKDGTIKILFMLDDKKTIETVLMPQKYGQSVCVTTQVGCKMSCTFCASGLIKTERNLTTSELVLQIYMMNLYLKKKYKNDLKNPEARVSHIVVMGIGEPMDNYDNVIRFIRIVNDPNGFMIGSRHITVSTCGVVPKIKEFTKFDLQVNLAISLHAPNNRIRNTMMPINKAYPIELLIKTVKEYIAVTNRRVTFEYILIDGVNDSNDNAEELAELTRGINGYINLIPYNEVEENEYRKSKNITGFYKTLKRLNVNAIVRKEFGSDIDAACGQLRAKREGILKNEI